MRRWSCAVGLRSPWGRFGFMAICWVLLNTGSSAQASNHSLLRESAGTIEYRSIPDGALRGSEQWTLMVHGDGSRTLNARIHNRQRDSRTHIIQRVDRDFRPLDAIVQRWTGDSYRGIGLFTVKNNVLTGLSRGPGIEASHEVKLAADVTLLSHAVAADAWLRIAPDLAAGPKRRVSAYSIALNDTTPPFLGKIIDTTVEWIARDRIDVPAGLFDTTHLRLAGRFDVWVFGPDRTLARMRDSDAGYEYVLVSYNGRVD